MKKGIQLISLHKSGSTWVQSYIHKKYRSFGVTLPPRNLYNEFLTNGNRKEDTDHIFVTRSNTKRIELLKQLREFGLELAHKAHVPEIVPIWPWFKEFYKEHDIIVLKRRHIFTHWLTILFYYNIKLATGSNVVKGNNKENYTYITPSKVQNGRDEDILKSTIQEYKIQFKFDEKRFRQFVLDVRFLNDVVLKELHKPQVIWTEDIDHAWLENRFNVIVKQTVEPFKTLDFATYFKPEDMAIIKEKFEERFYSEFQFFGYEYK